VLLHTALAPLQRLFLEIGRELPQRRPQDTVVALRLFDEEDLQHAADDRDVLRNRGGETVVAVGRDRALLGSGLALSVTVLIRAVLVFDLLDTDPALQQQR